MKGFRISYWATMLCALAFGLYSGNRFSWVLFLVLLFLLAAALGVNVWTAWSFSYVQKLSAEQGEKGQAVGLHIGIYNDKPFPFTRMKVTVEAPDPAETQVLHIDLAPNASCSFDLDLRLPMRGQFLVGMTRLDLQDVFGLLPMHFDLRRLPYYRQKPLLILPRVHDFSFPAGGTSRALGSGQARAGQEELSHLRRWMPGDKLSRVSWAASAKTHTLLTRQYSDPAGGSCLIWLDCQSLPDLQADTLAECAATLLYAHARQGDLVDLRSSRPQTQPPEQAFSLSGLTALRQWLALLKFDQATANREALAEAVRRETYGRIYVLGGRVNPETARLLETLETPCFYWVTEPLQTAQTTGRHIKPASFSGKELPEFLFQHLGDEL